MSYENHDDALAQIQSLGLEINDQLQVDTPKSIRVREVNGDKEKRGWYWLHTFPTDAGDFIVGTYGIFRGNDYGTQKIVLNKRCKSCSAIVPLAKKKCPSCGSAELKSNALTAEQKKLIAVKQKESRKKMEAQRKAEADKAANWAHKVWAQCRDVEPRGHEHLVRKKLNTTGGARIFESSEGLLLPDATADDLKYLATFHGALVVPMCDIASGAVRGLQFILSRDNEQHKKRIASTGNDKYIWPKGMENPDLAHIIGGRMHGHGLVVEGFATGLSLFEATGVPVAVAFNAGRMQQVGSRLHKYYKKKIKLTFCADDDCLQKCTSCEKITTVESDDCTHCSEPHKKKNAGLNSAKEAAFATSGNYLIPKFIDRPTDRKGPTDFNDLHCIEGLNAVRAQLEEILPQANGEQALVARGSKTGGAGKGRLKARISVAEGVDRYVGTYGFGGKALFDEQERCIVLKDDVSNLLPRHGLDEMRDHPEWRIVRHTEIGFDPTEKDPEIYCNLWGGWPTTPQSGSCEYLLDLLNYLCSGEENSQEIFGWLIKWLAYPIQNPGAKMSSAIVVHGPQGTGKSRFFEAYSKIYGEYGRVLDQSAIEDKFNADWASKKLFIVADEVVAASDMHHIKNRLKTFITGETIRVNTKNITAHTEKNCMNIVFLSNEKRPVVLENDDRRHCVLWSPPKLPVEVYVEVTKEIDAGGIEALHDHLLHVDLTGFTRNSMPPMTEAKQDLIQYNREGVDLFIDDWMSGELGIPFGPCLSRVLYPCYQKWSKRNGATYVMPIQQFAGSLKKRVGWFAGQKYYLSNLRESSSGKKLAMIVPALSDMRAADANQDMSQGLLDEPGHGQLAPWLTQWCNKIQDAESDHAN